MIDPRGWREVIVPSATSKGVEYIVLLSPFNPASSICECRGFEIRGTCSHIAKALQIEEENDNI